MNQPTKAPPRQRILEAADHLFYIDGIRATGTDKIMSVADVAKATFYREFESKDALVLAYLDLRDAAFWQNIFAPEPPRDIFEAISRIDRFTSGPTVVGCPFTLVASEFRNPEHPVHRRVLEHKGKILRLFVELLAPMGIDRAVALELLLAVDGALALRTLYGATGDAPLLAVASAILARHTELATKHLSS